MAIFDRLKAGANKRKIENDAQLTPSGLFCYGHTSSGEAVTPETSMRLTAVSCCVRILAETIAELPLGVYRYTADGGREKATDLKLYNVIHDEVNAEMTSYQFREMMMTQLCVYGNAYAQIIRNNRGEVVALYPLQANRMNVYRDNGGRLYYTYDRRPVDSNSDGEYEKVRFEWEDVLHVPGLGFNGITGLSPLSLARETLGSAIAAEKFAGSFFGNGASPSGILEYPKSVKDPQEFVKRFNEAYSGPKNAGKIPLLEDGMTFKTVSITPQDAQYLETRKFNINEIARIYRIPPHMLADLEKSSFSNIEQQSLEFVKYTIAPWVAKWEQALRQKLLTEEQKTRYFFAFNLEGLLRGDYASRMQGYSIARQNGWMSANDIRTLENMNKIPAEEGGDLYLVNGSMLRLSQAGLAYTKNNVGGTDK